MILLKIFVDLVIISEFTLERKTLVLLHPSVLLLACFKSDV